MPLIEQQGALPSWSEILHVDIIHLQSGDTFETEHSFPKEKWFVAEGSCEFYIGHVKRIGKKKDQLEFVEIDTPIALNNATDGTILIRVGGKWGEETGGSGFFEVHETDEPKNIGDPNEYERNTNIDNHYHDCDELYVIYEGRALVVSEGKPYEVKAGDCILTGKGHHHDIPYVYEPLKAIYFETTLQGLKRRGHLWNHTHGIAIPEMDRI